MKPELLSEALTIGQWFLVGIHGYTNLLPIGDPVALAIDIEDDAEFVFLVSYQARD